MASSDEDYSSSGSNYCPSSEYSSQNEMDADECKRSPEVSPAKAAIKAIKDSCKKKPFSVVKIKQADFKDLTPLQINIAKKDKQDDGSQFRFSEAKAFHFDEGMPPHLKVKYQYTDIEEFATLESD